MPEIDQPPTAEPIPSQANCIARTWCFGVSAVRHFFKERKSKTRAAVFGFAGLFFFGWAGFYYNNKNMPPWIPNLLMLMGGILESYTARQSIINYGKSDRMANLAAGAIVLAAVFLSVLNLSFEYHKAPDGGSNSITKNPPAPRLKDLSDMNHLASRYPFGFIVFSKGALDNKWQTYDAGETTWDIDWPGVSFGLEPDNWIHVNLPVRLIWNPKHRSGVADLAFQFFTRNVPNSPSALPLKMPDDPKRMFFEVLDNNPRRPVYVLGFGTENTTLKAAE